MSDGKDPVKDGLIDICAVVAAIVPFFDLIRLHHAGGPGLVEWTTNLICVSAFYFGSRKLLRRLETLHELSSDTNGVFRKIHASVADLSLIALSTITMAWALSDFMHH